METSLSYNTAFKYILVLVIIYYCLIKILPQKPESKDVYLILVTVFMLGLASESAYNYLNNKFYIINSKKYEPFIPVATSNPIDSINLHSDNMTQLVDQGYVSKNVTYQVNNQADSSHIKNDERVNSFNHIQQPLSTTNNTMQIKCIETNTYPPRNTTQSIISSTINNKLLINYYNLLIKELYNNKVLNDIDIKNIKLKLDSNLFTLEEIILQLENLKNQITINTNITNTNITNELSQDFFQPIGDKVSNGWKNDYTILNTNKWQVPMPRPPVCINNSPCKVCPTDSPNYINLQQWNDARYVLQKPQN